MPRPNRCRRRCRPCEAIGSDPRGSTMIWLLAVIGVVIGAAEWGFPGAITLGFLGWLLGVVLKSNARPVPEPGVRLDALDRRIAALEARLARVEGVEAHEEGPAAVPAQEVARPVAAQGP